MGDGMTPNYRICSRCVMDTSDPNITFNYHGECNHCTNYLQEIVVDSLDRENFLSTISTLKKLRTSYNCIVGVSGGLDSTFLLLHVVKDLGLRPLAVHVDNGWNTGLATRNINSLISACGVDLYTTVLDWSEFKLMQKALLLSGTPDLEAPTDLFINYSLRNAAYKFKVPCIISGTNPQTEAIMGSTWSYGQRDPIYLKNLYKKFNCASPLRLPFKSLGYSLYEQVANKINIVRPLRYIKYSRNMALKRSIDEAKWIVYPRKHGESFITRFYQDYFLPVRFGADKRRAHLSNLIMNKELSREDALSELSNSTFQSSIQADIEYFCTKLSISRSDFDEIMQSPKKLHTNYRTMKDLHLYKIGVLLKIALGTNNSLVRRLMRLISY